MKKLTLSVIATILAVFGLGGVSMLAPSANVYAAKEVSGSVKCKDGSSQTYKYNEGDDAAATEAHKTAAETTACASYGGVSTGGGGGGGNITTISGAIGAVKPDDMKEGDLWGLAKSIINIVLMLVGVVAVVVMILGGLNFITSQGDTAKVTKARNTILYGVVGLIVALLAYAIVNFVLTSIN